MKSPRLLALIVTALLMHAAATVASRPAAPSFFGRVTVSPAFELDGRGKNIDSLAFWTESDPTNTLLFVTAKRNQRVEVWKYPFASNEQTAITASFGPGKLNGVVVDQESDLL